MRESYLTYSRRRMKTRVVVALSVCVNSFIMCTLLLFLDPNKVSEIMQSLVSLSAKQSGKNLDTDPMSGADRSIRRSVSAFKSNISFSMCMSARLTCKCKY